MADETWDVLEEAEEVYRTSKRAEQEERVAGSHGNPQGGLPSGALDWGTAPAGLSGVAALAPLDAMKAADCALASRGDQQTKPLGRLGMRQGEPSESGARGRPDSILLPPRASGEAPDPTELVAAPAAPAQALSQDPYVCDP